MSALNESLDALDGVGVIEVAIDDARARVDVVQVGSIGLRMRGVSLSNLGPQDVRRRAHELSETLGVLGESLSPVEVDPGLKGAILRSKLDRDREFFEIELRGEGLELCRYRVAEGERDRCEWDMTRQQLEQTLEVLRGASDE